MGIASAATLQQVSSSAPVVVPAIMTGIAALSAKLGAVGGANFWNPVGWICLAVAAVAAIIAIVYFWEDIRNWFKSKFGFLFAASILLAPTLVIPLASTTDTWDIAAPVAPTITIPLPQNALEKVHVDVEALVRAFLRALALSQALTRGPWSVYDLHVGNTNGIFLRYVEGQPPTQFRPSTGDIYKYGMTTRWTVLDRYAAALRFPNNIKDQQIYGLILNGNLLPLEWYLWKYNYAIAHALEVYLIQSYKAGHNGIRPPGNPRDT